MNSRIQALPLEITQKSQLKEISLMIAKFMEMAQEDAMHTFLPTINSKFLISANRMIFDYCQLTTQK